MALKNWNVIKCNRNSALKSASELGIPPLTAILLSNRGFDTTQKMRDMLESKELSNPFDIYDMKNAAEIINDYRNNGELIAVYGDYDADGITATSMLTSYLKDTGANVCAYIPQREGEGYGMNMNAVQKLYNHGVKLIVTVDNGIASVKEVEKANSLGMKVVITDHHKVQEKIPDALAVVDPQRKEDTSNCKMLCGAGIVFKIIQALEGEYLDNQALFENYSELAAIGTVGDIVPLFGENRTIVRKGLFYLPKTERPGLRNLIELCAIGQKRITASTLAFSVVPRINATGRMGSPQRAVTLLTGEDDRESKKIAKEICEDNENRKKIEQQIFNEAILQLKNEPDRLYDKIIVVEGENWHHGVVGIVSSRITERFGKPSFVISVDKNEARGSGRSVDGFSLFDAVYSCKEIFTRYGGHPMAAGISMLPQKTAEFRKKINEYAKNIDMPMLQINFDGELKPDKLSCDIPKCAEMLEPFGTGNPSPLFALINVKITSVQPIGSNKNHIRITVDKNGCSVSCLKFGMTYEEFPYKIGSMIDLAVELQTNLYNGVESLSIIIRDMRLSGLNFQNLNNSIKIFEKLMRNEQLTKNEAALMMPDRKECAVIYKEILHKKEMNLSEEQLIQLAPFNIEKILVILQIFKEHNLLDINYNGITYNIYIKGSGKKVNLMNCTTARKLTEYLKESVK